MEWLLSFGMVMVYILLFGAFVVAWAEIFLKAGYSRWYCFLMIAPIANLVLFFCFAFMKWPVYEFVEKGWHAKRLKQKARKIQQEIEELEKEQ